MLSVVQSNSVLHGIEAGREIIEDKIGIPSYMHEVNAGNLLLILK
jgi:hypothetical protein